MSYSIFKNCDKILKCLLKIKILRREKLNISNYLLIGISLAMDAFAVCVCQGMAVTENKGKLGIKLGITFGCFQGLMPLLGYKIGNIFSDKISVYGNIIACIILVGIGINMIRERK